MRVGVCYVFELQTFWWPALTVCEVVSSVAVLQVCMFVFLCRQLYVCT